MIFFIAFLGGFIGIILAVILVVAIIYSKIKATVGKEHAKELKQVMSYVKDIARDEYTRVKDISGLTSLLEPRILKDFPEFNKDLLFSINEKNLRKIFNSIETKNVKEIENDSDLIYIEPQLRARIEDMESNKIDEQ